MGKILVTGATGLVGQALLPALLAQGHEVHVLSRDPDRHAFPGAITPHSWQSLPQALEGMDAVINLAGANLGDRRWSRERKRELLESRVGSTSRLVSSLQGLSRRPSLLIQASAVGFYGNRGEQPLDEQSPPGKGFLAELCRAWEASADAADSQGVRVVKLRLGVVLAREGGALPRMALPVRCFAGCRLGSGRQGFSWIHLQDLLDLILAALRNPAFEGPFNATSPGPVPQGEFTRELARRLHRPLWPLPARLTAAALDLVLGQMAQEMLLQGAFVHPKRALDLGFTFRFPDMESALSDLIRPARP